MVDGVTRTPTMRASLAGFAAAAAVLCSFAGVAVAIGSHPDVIEITQDNFQNTLDSHDVILIEFYAPWCGHCTSLSILAVCVMLLASSSD